MSLYEGITESLPTLIDEEELFFGGEASYMFRSFTIISDAVWLGI